MARFPQLLNAGFQPITKYLEKRVNEKLKWLAQLRLIDFRSQGPTFPPVGY